MPSSIPAQVGLVADLIRIAEPTSLLDVGTGFGKYGLLAREYADVWHGRLDPESWKCRIHGIEAFEAYISPVHRYLYDEVYLGDALKILPSLSARYSMTLLIDVIEHFDYKDGKELLAMILERSDVVVVGTPLLMEEQGPVFGNSHEIHKHQWTQRDLAQFGPATFFTVHSGNSGVIGLLGKGAKALAAGLRTSRRRASIKALLPFVVEPYRRWRYGKP